MITHPQNRIYLLQIEVFTAFLYRFNGSSRPSLTFSAFFQIPGIPSRRPVQARPPLPFLRFWSSPRPISSSQLHTLLHFHLCPIYLVVFKGTYFFKRMGDLILEGASRLDAFSVYPFPAWLPGCEPGGSAGAPEAGPPRSSRTKGSSPQISCAHAG